LLVANGAATTVYLSSAANIPDGDGPYLSLIETGGTGPEYVQNQANPAYQRPALQVVARAKNYVVARGMIAVAYNVLANKRNQTLGSVWYRSIRPLQEPFDIGLDDRQRARCAFNVLAVKRPS
jgi:hypothetical protein